MDLVVLNHGQIFPCIENDTFEKWYYEIDFIWGFEIWFLADFNCINKRQWIMYRCNSRTRYISLKMTELCKFKNCQNQKNTLYMYIHTYKYIYTDISIYTCHQIIWKKSHPFVDIKYVCEIIPCRWADLVHLVQFVQLVHLSHLCPTSGWY